MSIEFFHPDGSEATTSVNFFPGGEPRIEVDARPGADAIAFVRGAQATDLIVLAVWAKLLKPSVCCGFVVLDSPPTMELFA